MNPWNEPHLADIEQYCQDVRSGVRPACEWERLAVERHLNDLERQDTAGFPYRFDPELQDHPASASLT